MFVSEAVPMSTESETLAPGEDAPQGGKRERSTIRVIGWFSVGMAVAALSIYLGYELRCRSKFKKRTPYDFYANAGESHAGEFGVGI
jgi:hypothetical protein